MKKSQPLILVSITILLLLAVSILLCTQVLSRKSYTTALEVAQSQPFYRSPKNLAEEGVVLLELTRDQKDILNDSVRSFFVTEYRGILRQEYNEYKQEAISDEVFAQALISPPLFSEPRWYEDLEDIENAVAIIASTQVYIPTDEDFETGAAYIFFFREEDGEYRLDEFFPVGEDNQTFETWPVENYRESLTPSE